MKTRYVNFAGQSLSVEYSPDFSELIEFLYSDTNADPGDSPDATLSVREVDGVLTLHCGEEQLYRGSEKSVLATTLIRETIRQLIDKNAGGMALHAAALSRNSRGILIPGQSGSGKTSLSTWLAARGFNYLTDEYVFIRHNTNTMEAFARPPNIKVRGIEAALEHFFDMDKHEDQTIQSKHVAMIPSRLLNPENIQENPTVDLILFPRFRKNSNLKLEKLSKAKSGLALMESLVNARNLNGHGFTEAARLARDAPGYRLEYGGFDQLQEEFDNILP